MKVYRNIAIVLLPLILFISCASLSEDVDESTYDEETVVIPDSKQMPIETDPEVSVRQRNSSILRTEQSAFLMPPEIHEEPAVTLDHVTVHQSWTDIPLRLPEPPRALEPRLEISEPTEGSISETESAALTADTPAQEPAADPTPAAPSSPATPSPSVTRSAASRISPLNDSPPDISDGIAEITQTSAVNQPFIVLLSGDGWIYTGEESGNPDISFRSRNSNNGDTVFRFIAENTGVYLLVFQRQDLQQGLTERKLAEVSVITEATPTAEEPGASASAHMPGGEEYPGDTGSLSAVQPLYDSAENHTFQNIASALAEGDSSVVRETIRQQYLLPDSEKDLFEDVDVLTSAAEVLRSSYDPGDSITAQTLSALNDISALGPEGLFWLGQHYESSSVRDYQQSVQMYEQLIRRFPYHQLAEQAGVRSRFIRRHFLDIL